MANSAITAPTPMLMPSMVSAARSLLAASVCSDRRATSSRYMRLLPNGLRRHLVWAGQYLVANWIIAGDQTIRDADDAARMVSNARVVRHKDNSDPALLVQALEKAHDLRT